MIEKGVFHLVIALRIGQRVIGLAKMPFAGEIGLVAPFFSTDAASIPPSASRRLTWKARSSIRCVGMRPSALRRGGRAARLRVEGEEGQAFAGQPVDVRRRHARPSPPP